MTVPSRSAAVAQINSWSDGRLAARIAQTPRSTGYLPTPCRSPDTIFDLVDGVSPTLSIDQKTVNRNPRRG
jgi:hypothetical protein